MKDFKLLCLIVIAFVAYSCNSASPKSESKSDVASCTETTCPSGGCGSCSSHEQVVVEDISDAKVQVYYFHATRRCATCEAVEKVTKETIDENFLEDVAFVSINREKEEKLVEKFKVSGQTLLIVCGDKIVDLTKEAFLNARTNPDKFAGKLKTAIETYLN
ncbi:nitrophenyl compound nitroreductase subunit ArsF family protein [Plebeiibacterium marinum]|uniref:Thioredoxin family protein n=1 Tax=Plebeiibacterium marinum TaxID=2992111 RepID=A0AAE3MER6_9BACT|nr:nitrophenyl compound nitroreductase subunit ArsF family protein [Plebeiobacterium marinum]MCW3806613.1 thioredoxin family protein [Plebeiobacterium marinum]